MPESEKELEIGQREILNDSTNMTVRWINKNQVFMSQHNDKMVRTGKLNKKLRNLS